MSMKATALYAAKREVIDRIDRASKTVGHVLADIQVAYMRPGNVAEIAIYGGSGRSTYGEADAENQLVRETLTFGLYIRRLGVKDEAREIEAEVERYADAVVTLLHDDPELAGMFSFGGLVASIADVYAHFEQIEVILGLSLRLDTWLGADD